MVKKILIAVGLLAALVAGFVLVAALRPADYRVERSIAISAPPATAFGPVNDLHRWKAWSPWPKLDPAAKYTFEGPPAGAGDTNTWSGNNQIGEGRQTIVESRPDELVRIRFDFKRPFESTSMADFIFRREGDQTVVTWSTFGQDVFIEKAVWLVLNRDKLIGEQFEKGLADLKATAEAAAR